MPGGGGGGGFVTGGGGGDVGPVVGTGVATGLQGASAWQAGKVGSEQLVGRFVLQDRVGTPNK